MKRIIYISLLSILSLSIISCKNNKEKETSSTITTKEYENYIPDSYLDDVDNKFFLECEHKGTYFKSSYPSYDYLTNNREKMQREFNIYLPYGYDENDLNTKYDILYLMHGWMGSINSFSNSFPLINMLDNMINDNLIKPLIVVNLTYDINNDTSSLYKGLAEIKVFHNDLIDSAIPFIENNYHTYLNNNLDNLVLSRSHRGFGGFSLGGCATWFELLYNHDYISKFLPMSGVLLNTGTVALPRVNENAEFFLEEENKFHNLDYQIYAASGTEDILYVYMNEFIRRIKPNINNKLSYHLKIGARHKDSDIKTYLYNGLINLYGVENE